MQELYGEGVALRPDPEPCAGRREASGEASAGAHAGPVLSCEIDVSGCRLRYRTRKATPCRA